MVMGFIDTMRSEGHAVLSICRVLREQGCQIAARTYRAWRGRHVAARTVTDAQVLDVVRDTAWVDVVDATGRDRRKLAPEGLYGRRKMTVLVRRTTIPGALRGAIDRAGEAYCGSGRAAGRGSDIRRSQSQQQATLQH